MNARRTSRALARNLRFLARVLAREGVGSWVAIVLVVGAIAALQQTAAFTATDGRFFDIATTREAGTRPTVVIVEVDKELVAPGRGGIPRLETALERLGVERVGYLDVRNWEGAAGRAIPAVIGLSPSPVPASDRWQLPPTEAAPAIPSARVLASAQYGIYRQQWSALPGIDKQIPSFETALAGRTTGKPERFFIRMPVGQSVPVITASQVLDGQLAVGELAGTVAILADPSTVQGSLTTPLDPTSRATSEAHFRAYAIQALRAGRIVLPARTWESWLLIALLGAAIGIAYMRSDPKRLAILLPLAVNLLVLAIGWAALQFAGRLLPVTAMLIVPWLVSFLRVLGRERWQDRRLEDASARAVQHAFGRSALREGARLPEFVRGAARFAGVEKSLLIERKANGSIGQLNAYNADFGDIAVSTKELDTLLATLRARHAVVSAEHIVPGWPGQARISWLGGTERDLYWLYSLPQTAHSRKTAHIVRAVTASFRELFRWRANLNARKRLDQRYVPIDDKVASAISLVAQSSDQIRHGFDTVGTAVMIFHMVGSPLHANAPMHAIYRKAGLSVGEATVAEALLRLTELDEVRIDAMLQDLLLNGGEMRVPMRSFGPEEYIFRIAAPQRVARSRERVIVLEAIDVSELHRAADLRQAVALFMDLQLRNDFEAIMLGSELASDPRVTGEQVKPIVARITETTRRAIARLDEVAELVREDIWALQDASYPVDARSLVLDATERTADFAQDLDVRIETELPGASGFTIAEPTALGAMLRAILRVLIADTPQGDSVKLVLEELDERTHIRISGGFGIALERLLQLLSNHEGEAIGDFRTISEGMARAIQWDASVSYWGREADGFGFNINLRRIG
ncbi:ATP-binding protein [Parerythrobacter aestuarii]|uniref:hypothetical protein n=1 Tax=Parerythrobacter aestuarii TaxID=3020909 RepID=UPI0024DEE742|nr:hypothetical protein [Parerythrobacter aestuarii]